MKTIFYIALVLFFQIGQGLTFQMFGVMNFGWILALVYTVIYLFPSHLLRNKDFCYVSKLYFFLTIVGLFAEYMVGNTMTNALKGAAINVVSYTSFFFLLSMFLKDRRLIFWALVGIVIKMLIFGFDTDSSVEEALDGESATYLKFYVGPLIVYIMLILSLFFHGKTYTYVFILFGLSLVVSGARSLGLTVFLIGVFAWTIRVKKKDLLKYLRKFAIPIALLFYGLYCVYVTNVLDGNISAGNNTQLLRSDNPYNPVEIIKMSRTDAWVGMIAFADAPLWGHGAWAMDKTLKYHMIMANVSNGDFKVGAVGSGLIPGHSVIIGKAVQNGVFAMIILIMLVLFFLKRAFKMLNEDNKYVFIMLYMIVMNLVWHSLFSPVGHIRDTYPLTFAFVMVCWFDYKQRQELENNKC